MHHDEGGKTEGQTEAARESNRRGVGERESRSERGESERVSVREREESERGREGENEGGTDEAGTTLVLSSSHGWKITKLATTNTTKYPTCGSA